MATLKLNSQIVDSITKVDMEWNGMEGISFEDVKNFISNIPEDDKDIDIRINCAGGDCVEGWAIYDALRQSAKNISAVIEGQCSSMASVIYLAAPKENRKAYANAHLCIHNPEACWLDVDYYSRLTADNIDAMTEKMKNQAESLRAEQQKILDLYVERTGSDAETLQDLMNQDIFINMDRAKELGFVGETLVPNTASRTKNNFFNMANKNEQKSAAAKTFHALGIALGFITDEEEKKMQSLSISTPAGDELIVEREEGNPQVGDAASPDGTFVLDDGTTIVVENGVITSITKETEEETEEEDSKKKEDEKTQALTDPSTGNEISEEEAQNLLNEIASRISELEQKLAESEEDAKNEKEKNEALAASQMTDEQKEILSIVDEKGGKEWLDIASKMRSYGFHKKTAQQDMKDPNKQPETKKIGAGFLARHTEGYKKMD